MGVACDRPQENTRGNNVSHGQIGLACVGKLLVGASPRRELAQQAHTPYNAGVCPRCRQITLFFALRPLRDVRGVVDSDALIARLRDHTEQPISRLAKWIVAREVLHFGGDGKPYFPLFQFTPTDMTLRPEVRSVVAELRGVIDDAALVIWFVHPHTLLGNRQPAAVLIDEPAAVVAAARAERFSIKG